MFNCLTLNDAPGKKTNFCVVLCVLNTLMLSGSGENSRFEKPSGIMQSVTETVTHLSEETHGYIVNLVGAKTVEATQQVSDKEYGRCLVECAAALYVSFAVRRVATGKGTGMPRFEKAA